MSFPLTWDIPLESPPEVVMIGRNAHGFEPVDRFCLPDLWSLHLYGYHGRLKLGGHEVEIRPGALGLTPPNTVAEYRYFGLSVHIYAHFILPPGPTRKVSIIQDTGEGYTSLHARLNEAVGLFSREPKRVSVRLWDVLWDAVSLTGSLDSGNPNAHHAVRYACDVIERHLGGPLTVRQLAQEVQVSQNYLTRLFQDAYGTSVTGYIRRRRMERAGHLLTRSTLPIKIIASSVGISDLQQFNKTVRAEYGMSPRELRIRGELT